MEQFCKENWKQYAPEISGKVDENYRTIEAGKWYMPYKDKDAGFGITGCISPVNAALIAAAPDLYEALKGAVSMLREAANKLRECGNVEYALACELWEMEAKESLAKARNEILP